MWRDRTSLAEARERALAAGCRCVLLLGASDTGKTRFLEELLSRSLEGGPVSVVDADMGQSHIGPPATIGWSTVSEKFPGWENLPPRGLYFVGSTSPFRHLIPSLAGTVLLHRKAVEATNRVFVDTSGFVHGPAARALCWSMVDLIQPDLIIAIEREAELEDLLLPLQAGLKARILRCGAAVETRAKSREERVAYRKRQFARYLGRARPRRLDLRSLGLRLVGGNGPRDLEVLSSRLVSLRVRNDEDAALGLVTHVDRVRQEITVVTPLEEAAQPRVVVVGDVRLRLDGSEVPAPFVTGEGPEL